MSEPKRIGDFMDQLLEELGVHPLIIEAADREAEGERVDWEEIFARCAEPCQQSELVLAQ